MILLVSFSPFHLHVHAAVHNLPACIHMIVLLCSKMRPYFTVTDATPKASHFIIGINRIYAKVWATGRFYFAISAINLAQSSKSAYCSSIATPIYIRIMLSRQYKGTNDEVGMQQALVYAILSFRHLVIAVLDLYRETAL